MEPGLMELQCSYTQQYSALHLSPINVGNSTTAEQDGFTDLSKFLREKCMHGYRSRSLIVEH